MLLFKFRERILYHKGVLELIRIIKQQNIEIMVALQLRKAGRHFAK